MRAGYERIGHDVSVYAAQRGCLDKIRYNGRNEARDQAAHMRKNYPERLSLRPYRCTICHGFHLTSQVPRGLRQR